ncbi:cytochrome c4 [Eikenella sp. S3360]|uniref:Cytochrome c4 n=1 Tax=Eikenella glucosivorans TaxID=2766967 RepID=A0ABS0N873_9NEIS|nr:c-type cytochrome [Eikenella glucosivorans]MBH5328506.1 cytochrome c4 [Eikenella glucosivorans]
MKHTTLAGLLLAVSGFALAAPPAADTARGKQIADTVCAACHGADGNTNIAMYPRLSGQHPAYIIQQTLAIKAGQRNTGAAVTMRPLVENLSEQDIANVAAYFYRQIPKSGETNPKENPELGARLFRGGIASRGIPACMSCHGPGGAGIPGNQTQKEGTVAYPRLAGQHKSYIVDQLRAYQSGLRGNSIMSDIAKRMSNEEMDAVGNFIQGLQ